MKVNLTGRMLAVAITILSLVNASPLLADSIIDITGFSVTASPLDIDQISINRFDSTLGTLTKVHVSIQGVLALSVQNAPNFMFLNAFPISYNYNIRVHQWFYGMPSSIFFSFQDPGGTFNIVGNSSGNADIFNYTTLFSYNFDFTPITDLAGGTVPTTSVVTPPPFIEGVLADFIQGMVPLNEIDVRQWHEYLGGLDSLGASAPYPLSITSSAGGSLQITYNYTPVPLPSTLVLLGSGLMSLVGWRRFRKG